MAENGSICAGRHAGQCLNPNALNNPKSWPLRDVTAMNWPIMPQIFTSYIFGVHGLVGAHWDSPNTSTQLILTPRNLHRNGWKVN